MGINGGKMKVEGSLTISNCGHKGGKSKSQGSWDILKWRQHEFHIVLVMLVQVGGRCDPA